MAKRRMFSKEIVRSDAFLDLPVSSRELYFQLGMDTDGGEYAGFMVDIPPMFIDKAIKDLLLSYVDSQEDLKIEQDTQNSVLVFEIRLWGELGVSIIYNHQFLGGGFSGKTAYTTAFPQRDCKKLLDDVKKDIDEWVDNHPDIAGKSAQA